MKDGVFPAWRRSGEIVNGQVGRQRRGFYQTLPPKSRENRIDGIDEGYCFFRGGGYFGFVLCLFAWFLAVLTASMQSFNS